MNISYSLSQSYIQQFDYMFIYAILQDKMNKYTKNNTSALLKAGEASLSHLDHDIKNYNTYNHPSFVNGQSNHILYQSNVRQVYKRQPKYYDEVYNTNQMRMNLEKQVYNTNQMRMNLDKESRYQSGQKRNKEMNNNSFNGQIGSGKDQINKYLTIPGNSQKTYTKFGIIDNQRIKKIMMKLTFIRLRKIQALVRGFLVRRKVYPKLLEQYLLARSILSLIQANVVYRQISTIIMQTITFPKYQDGEQAVQMYTGRQKILQDLVYQSIITRVIRSQLKPIIQQSLTQKGLLMSRPQITFGFNLRDPLQLLLYQKVLTYANSQLRQICLQAISEYAIDRRQLFIVDQWMQKHQMLKSLYEEIANQLLEQNIGEYIVSDLMNKMTKQAAFVVAENVYNDEVNDWYMRTVQQIKQQVQQNVREQAFSQALVEMGYGVQSSNDHTQSHL